MTDLDNLKRKWQQIEIPVDTGDIAARNHADREALRPIKERIIRRFYRITACCVLALILSAEFFKEIESPLWFCIIYLCYFVFAGACNFILIHRIKKTDIYTLPTIDAINAVTGFMRTRNRFRAALICCAVPLLAMMFIFIYHGDEPISLIGGIAGGIAGILIGIIINRRINKEFRLMKERLGAAE